MSVKGRMHKGRESRARRGAARMPRGAWRDYKGRARERDSRERKGGE